MTFEYDVARALARIKAGLSQRIEDRKPEGTPAKLANLAKVGSATQDGLADLASLAGVHPEKCMSSADITGSAVAATAAASTPIIACAGGNITGSGDISASGDITGSGDIIASTNISASGDIIGSTPIIASTNIIGSGDIVAPRRPEWDEWATEDWQVYFDERASIAEFDGGLRRAAAEARAFNCCIAEWLYRNAVISPPVPCPICGDADRPNDPLLAIGLAGAGRVWLHVACSTAWCTARKAEAVAALAAMGIRGLASGST